MTGSSQHHLHFPTFRTKQKPKGISHLDYAPSKPIVPPTPSFGLFLPTPLPASSDAASPYLNPSPEIFQKVQHPPRFRTANLGQATRTLSVVQPAMQQPRYQLHEAVQAYEGACGEAGWLSPIPPTPLSQDRPIPNPFQAQPRSLPAPPSPRTPKQSVYHRPVHSEPRARLAPPVAHAQPGQVLTTSSTAYCRQITTMSQTPVVDLRRSLPAPQRPAGPRRIALVDNPVSISQVMRRDASSNTSFAYSEKSNVTDLRRRSALKSLPPSRDYSSSSNRSHRQSLLSAVSPPRQHSSEAILSDNLVESPPQAEFISDFDGDTLSWQPEQAEEDEAKSVWRKLEVKMGRRMNSSLGEQRGRWVVTPSASPLPEAAAMSPGQFSVSDYMMFGEETGTAGDEVYAESLPRHVPGTPYPHPDESSRVDIRRSRRTKSRLSHAPPSALDTLDDSLFPIAPPAPVPPKTKADQKKRASLCRLDTHVISALEALKSDWASPELDLALGTGTQFPSPLGPTPIQTTAPPSKLSRPLPLPSLTRRAASPPDATIATPPTLPRPPLSPLERGLGLGMSIALGTTYGLPSKPLQPAAPVRKSTRPLPSPVQNKGGVSRQSTGGLSRKSTSGLSRKSTVRVDRAKTEGMFVIRDLDTGEAYEVGMEGLEAALQDMANRA